MCIRDRYGDRDDLADEDTVPAPTSPYGASKLAAEKLAEQWQVADPTRCVTIIRPCAVYGERNISNMMKMCIRDRTWADLRAVYQHQVQHLRPLAAQRVGLAFVADGQGIATLAEMCIRDRWQRFNASSLRVAPAFWDLICASGWSPTGMT